MWPHYPKTLDEIFFKLYGLGKMKIRVRDTKSLHDYLVSPGKVHGDWYMGVNLDSFMNHHLSNKLPQFFLLSTPEELDLFKGKSVETILGILMPNYTHPATT